ncbi:MAG: RNA polymerase sigma factor [Chitinophagia bacterium]|nr:RNA polymerase sigma factor [Chitinophagia bacterium]
MQEALYRKYSARMYAVCLRYAGSADDAKDFLQEGFVKVYRNLERFRGEGSFEGWMRRIFVRTAIEHLRARRLQTAPLPEGHDTDDESGWSALDGLALEDLMRMIRLLPDGYRTVFNLYAVEGYSHREIGEMLGISEGTSKSQLARARKALQEMIGDKY